MTGKKNPVIISGRAPEDFMIEYDGESAERSPWHKKKYPRNDEPSYYKEPNAVMPPAPEEKPKAVCGRQCGKTRMIVDDLIERMKQKRLDAIMKDEKKSWREEIQLCKVCAYTNWMGGQAFTTTTGKKCGKEMTFPSTVTDMYCMFRNCTSLTFGKFLDE